MPQTSELLWDPGNPLVYESHRTIPWHSSTQDVQPEKRYKDLFKHQFKYQLSLTLRGSISYNLTAITLMPLALSAKTCLKKISAVPLTGGKHTKGAFTLLGPESYIFHPCKQKVRSHNVSPNKEWHWTPVTTNAILSRYLKIIHRIIVKMES